MTCCAMREERRETWMPGIKPGMTGEVTRLLRSFPRKRESSYIKRLGTRWSLRSGRPKAGPEYGDERKCVKAPPCTPKPDARHKAGHDG